MTVYFSEPYSLRRRTVYFPVKDPKFSVWDRIFSQKDRIFSQKDRIFFVRPIFRREISLKTDTISGIYGV